MSLSDSREETREDRGLISTLQLFCHPLGFLRLCGRAVDHPPHQSVLQVLEIEDPVVANCLIDMRGIESILLFMVGPGSAVHTASDSLCCVACPVLLYTSLSTISFRSV